MVILILIIAACGVLAAGSIRGWFDTGTESWITSGHVSGVASIERNGIGYSLQDGQGIKDGDVIETKQGSTASLQLGKSNTIVLNENTELTVTSADAEAVELSVGRGELFADIPKAGKSFVLKLDEHEAKIGDSVFSASVQTGSVTFDVYMGENDVCLLYTSRPMLICMYQRSFQKICQRVRRHMQFMRIRQMRRYIASLCKKTDILI